MLHHATDNKSKEMRRQFREIVENELIYPVYQPIVSLKNGEVLGYEALTRLDMKDCLLNPEEFFHMAQKMDCLWKVEEMCRRRSLQNAGGKKKGVKLFLNVDPHVMKDPMFRNGVTCQFLNQFKLCPEDIVFEITERNSIDEEDNFRDVIRHYQNQNFEIAIDDFGNGYAGMNRICALEPQYIKIDSEIIRSIDNDELKKSLVESMIQFCRKSHIRLIAEGIETKEELNMLIQLGVPYGQGYYIKRPSRTMDGIDKAIVREICGRYDSLYTYNPRRTVLGTIGDICSKREVTHEGKMSKEIYLYMQEHPLVTEVVVLGEDNEVHGMLTRAHIMAAFGGLYGYGLSMKSTVGELMDKSPLIVDRKESIEEVSRRALMRSQRTLYDAVVVTHENEYCGVVTVKELLEAAISIQVHRAVETNPLTGLPGNTVIDERVHDLTSGTRPYAIVYMDIDNFKAYNDAYGFNNGDRMIQALADSMRQCCTNGEFLGHIGGDDFVLIKEQTEIMPLLAKITECFQEYIEPLYSREDYERGYIVSKDRHGRVDKFPIVTLSMAIVSNEGDKQLTMQEFSRRLVTAKKKSKEQEGNSFYAI
ncbi:GGDEF domain-containing protein [Agathobacter sp.]|uniref:GGDEF domain-containing protein n=1 Tax=Agathobacter sp. TaxID=2021311 RepID=UPI003FD6D350